MTYRKRVLDYEATGCTTSDARAMCDAEDRKGETMSKHTPGPWKLSRDGNDIENADGAGVCAMYADETAPANAALIAAAPDLLEALERALAVLVAARELAVAQPMMKKSARHRTANSRRGRL